MIILVFVTTILWGTGFSCKSKSSTPLEEDKTILIQVYNDTSVAILEQNYSAYELRKEKVVSRPMHIYLFTYNTNKIIETELIKQLKTSDLVKEAQSNKNVQSRN
ncbi:MAG: hypothetical protein AAF489_15855 [Bacteroidota bacterium]